jgi:hypothetical protein
MCALKQSFKCEFDQNEFANFSATRKNGVSTENPRGFSNKLVFGTSWKDVSFHTQLEQSSSTNFFTKKVCEADVITIIVSMQT